MDRKCSSRRYSSIILIGVFIVSLLYPLWMMQVYRDHAIGGIYFQEWSSDYMMQTLPATTLRAHPLESLYYLHKQPPMLDAIRATIIYFLQDVPDVVLEIYLDGITYQVWAVLFALLTTLIVAWLWRMTSLRWALIGGLLWMLHPAPLFYATLLEGSLLTTLLITLYFYQFWRVQQRDADGIVLTLVAVVLFYTRTIFQWYFFPIHFLCLLLLRVPFKKWGVSLLMAGMLIAPFLVKHMKEYRTLSTTTYAGYHKCGLIWYQPSKSEIARVGKALNIQYPQGSLKYIGNERQNHMITHAHHLIYSKICQERFKADPIGVTGIVIGSFFYNVQKSFAKPSADYQYNHMVHRLWWKPVYDVVFSGWPYIVLMLLAVVSIMCYFFSTHPWPWRQAIVLLPFGFVFLIIHLANRHEWTEVDRLKFFIEPLIYIVCIQQLYSRIKGVVNNNVTNQKK